MILLVAEPAISSGTLIGSTFLGGSSKDGHYETHMAVDGDGHVFVAGRTRSTDFPYTPGCYQDEHSGGTNDMFVAKFNADLSMLIAATYLGGTGDDGSWPGVCLALDSDGNVFVAGRTYSSDFPQAIGTLRGSSDIIIAKLDNSLENLLVARYVGGTSNEFYPQLAMDPENNVVLSGTTSSGTTFPTSTGAFQTSYGGGAGGPYPGDVFVCKFSNDLSTVVASTFLGHLGNEYCEALRVDSQGRVYLAGWTGSASFPTSPTAYRRVHYGGYYDCFVSILSSDLTSLDASTFIGGTAWDFVYSLTLDDMGNVFVAGHTASTDYPTTAGAHDRIYNGTGVPGIDDDVFISKFDANLENLLASTYLGSTGWELATCLTLSDSGEVFVAGNTRNGVFPVTPGTYDDSHNGGDEFFLALLTEDLSDLRAATYIGGSYKEVPDEVISDPSGNVYICGITESNDYPVLSSSYDDSYNGNVGPWLNDDEESYGGDAVITLLPAGYFKDADGDGHFDLMDNCPITFNPDQEDTDFNGIGDSCDCCIPPSVGDLDESGGDLGFNYDGADLSLMINGLFIDPTNGWDGICLDEADVDFSAPSRPVIDPMKIDGADLSILIDALFIAPTHFLKDCDGTDNY